MQTNSNHHKDALRTRILLSLLPFFLLLVMVLIASYEYYTQVRQKWIEGTCSIYRETVEVTAGKFVGLSEDIVLYSKIFSQSPHIQEMLTNRKKNAALSTAIDDRLMLLKEEFVGKISSFQLYDIDAKLLLSYPETGRALPVPPQDLQDLFARAATEQNLVVKTFTIDVNRHKPACYVLYASPVFSPGKSHEVIGFFCSWLDLNYASSDFFSTINYTIGANDKSDIFLLSETAEILHHAGTNFDVSLHQKLPFSILRDFPSGFLSPSRNLLLKHTRMGEGRDFYFVITPVHLSVKTTKSLITGPDLLLVLVSPKSLLHRKLEHSAIYIVIGSVLFVILIIIPSIMIFRTYYALEKERMKILEKELKLAYDIQMGLLPKGGVTLEGSDIFGDSIPARQVGGDFFDFFHLQDRSIDIAIGDVSGKGMPSALMMSMTKTLISSLARQDAEPAKVLALVNRSLYESTDSGLFVTALMGHLDMARKVLTFANAGHTLPLLCRNGEIQEIEAEGMILGCLPDTSYEQQEFPLMSGDILILYTDGLSDVWNDKGEKIEERELWSEIKTHGESSAQKIAAHLFRKVEEHQGKNDQYDDRTIVVIKIE